MVPEAERQAAEWMSDERSFAHELADLAADVASRHRGSRPFVRDKPDGTPVTAADEEIEAAMRSAISARFPLDGVEGEEGATKAPGHGDRTWVIDPIDGTKNFVEGLPLWTTLIGLRIGAESVLGVVSAPELGERYVAVRGDRATLNGAPIRVSTTGSLGEAFVLHSSIKEWLPSPYRGRLEAIAGAARLTRGIADAWGHMLVARGSADVTLEHEPCAAWDWTAVRVIIEEAGGRLSAFDGREPFDGCTLVSTNDVLHGEVLDALEDR